MSIFHNFQGGNDLAQMILFHINSIEGNYFLWCTTGKSTVSALILFILVVIVLFLLFYRQNIDSIQNDQSFIKII